MSDIWEEILESIKQERLKNCLNRTLPSIEKRTGRTVTINGRELINMSGNDYLGLSEDRRIIEAGYKLSLEAGCGSTGSRLMSGNLKFIEEFEEELAEMVNMERTLIFNSGWHANLSIISSLADKDTIVFCDRLNHASIYDAIRLSGCRMTRYHHTDMEDLSKKLKDEQSKKKIIVTESVFSMDGDIAPLEEIINLAKEHSALLIVDEAHGFGVFGENGAGILEERKLSGKADLLMATFGKSCGVAGAFVAGSSLLIEHLINHARPFIFSTALPPFVIGAARESVKIIKSERPGVKLIEKSKKFRESLKKENISYGRSSSQIVPIIVGENDRSISLRDFLSKEGFFCQAIRPPTVPPSTSRIRLSLNLLIKEEDLSLLIDSIRKFFLCV